MKLYDNIHRAEFLQRPNRFIARCRLEGAEVVCHVKNTGRCRELLYPGAEVYLTRDASPRRKTAYDLVAARKGEALVNLDSQAPNRVFREWALAGQFQPGLAALLPEQRYGESRFDFAYRAGASRGFVEVKGVTLEEDGVACFPDAPTLRGLKHVRELAGYAARGWRCCVLVVIQMAGVRCFRPNWATQPAFGQALRQAAEAGVELRALDCTVTPGSIALRRDVPVDLTPPAGT